MGLFYDFIPDESVQLIGCEAAGRGIHTAQHAATIATGTLGIFHGMKSYFCQDQYVQIAPVYSISAGLDYPGIGPEHANLHDTGRAQYVSITCLLYTSHNASEFYPGEGFAVKGNANYRGDSRF